jgi:hypothetical protein
MIILKLWKIGGFKILILRGMSLSLGLISIVNFSLKLVYAGLDSIDQA